MMFPTWILSKKAHQNIQNRKKGKNTHTHKRTQLNWKFVHQDINFRKILLEILSPIRWDCQILLILIILSLFLPKNICQSGKKNPTVAYTDLHKLFLLQTLESKNVRQQLIYKILCYKCLHSQDEHSPAVPPNLKSFQPVRSFLLLFSLIYLQAIIHEDKILTSRHVLYP